MILLKNIVTNKIYRFLTYEESAKFIEDYENPNQLVSIDELFFDGGGWNGVDSNICFGLKNNFTTISFKEELTNNEAEYKALIHLLLNYANYDDLIKGDSQLVIKQMNGEYKCKSANLIPLHNKAKRLAKDKNLTFKWVRRNYNLAGIELDKRKLLKHKAVLKQ